MGKDGLTDDQVSSTPMATAKSIRRSSGSSCDLSAEIGFMNVDKQQVEECSSAAKLLSSSSSAGDSPCIPSAREPTDAQTLNVHENDLPKNNKVRKQISKDDLLCSACKELLVRPVVLNCGHVYCEGCVVDMAKESRKIKCKECHVCDPRGFPNVCLFLDELVRETFAEEYNSRRSVIQKTHAHTSKGSFQSYHKEGTSLSVNNNNDMPYGANPESNVHIGAGCDSCGVYPIIGDRYRCKDCKEEIGYDLCKDCYETPSKVPGRFNQQHTPVHRLERAEVPLLLINLSSIGFLNRLETVNSTEGGDTDEGEERPHGSSNESSST